MIMATFENVKQRSFKMMEAGKTPTIQEENNDGSQNDLFLESTFSMNFDATENKQINKLITRDKEQTKDIFKMFIVMGIPVVSLLAITSVSLANANNTQNNVLYSQDSLKNTLILVNLIGNLQKERGLTTIYLSANRSVLAETNLRAQYNATDVVVQKVLRLDMFPFEFDIPGESEETVLNRDTIRNVLERHRYTALNGPLFPDFNLEFYTEINHGFEAAMAQQISLPEGNQIWKTYTAMSSLLFASDAAGLQRALGGSYYSSCLLSPTNKLYMSELEGELKGHLLTSNQFGTHSEKFARFLEEKADLLDNLTSLKTQILLGSYDDICLNTTQEDRVVKGLQWFNISTSYINFILEFLAQDIGDLIDLMNVQVDRTETEFTTYLLLMIFLTLISIFLGTVYTLSIKEMTSNVSKYGKRMIRELAEEKKRTDLLLFQMLPKSVATALKNKERIIPEYYDCVTIYFSDIIGFTTIGSSCTPYQIVALLNGLYGLFDSSIAKHDVYKVETIGDAYMVASGVPERNGKEHAKHITEMSLEILELMKEYKAPHDPSLPLQIRIGIHSGPVAAGVVGSIMPRYCLFGNTVNVASRMESNSKALAIHISKDTERILAEIGGFIIEKRGEIEVKGKGKMTTYWVKGKVAKADEKHVMIQSPGLSCSPDVSDSSYPSSSEYSGSPTFSSFF